MELKKIIVIYYELIEVRRLIEKVEKKDFILFLFKDGEGNVL